MDGVKGITVAYYVTVLVVGAGLTALLGFEIGWLFAHSRPSLVMAGVLAPWVVFFAWALSEEL